MTKSLSTTKIKKIAERQGIFMKKIIKKIKEWITWLFSADVRAAVNAGATYEEVAEIVEREANGNV